MVSKEENIKFLDNAMSSLNQLATNPSTPRNIRKSITSLLEELKSEEYSMSVRAANTTSLLDDITQDPNMPSYVRTSLWQNCINVRKYKGINLNVYNCL